MNVCVSVYAYTIHMLMSGVFLLMAKFQYIFLHPLGWHCWLISIYYNSITTCHLCLYHFYRCLHHHQHCLQSLRMREFYFWYENRDVECIRLLKQTIKSFSHSKMKNELNRVDCKTLLAPRAQFSYLSNDVVAHKSNRTIRLLATRTCGW